MEYAFFAIGMMSAVSLLPLLAATLINPQFRIWPPPGQDSWQSMVFWPLFRLLNVAAFATALASGAGFLGFSSWLRGIAVVGLAVSGAAYIYALFVLGKRNTYCNADGLVTQGIYRWTRNPQYATVIPVYAFLAVAADNGHTYVLCSLMIAVYVLMALVEEPWLEACYGAPYRRYCRRVPRFFNWHRAKVLAGRLGRHVLRLVSSRLSA